MANSKYEYVKSFEVEDEIMLPNLIVVHIDGRHFQRFSKIHKFERPNDEKALNLMNSCAVAVLKEYPDMVFSYGYSDKFSFVFKKTTKFYQRRASKILSLIVSFFASVYVTKWKDVFPCEELRYPPSFRGHVISCASIDVLQHYLAWKQHDCHESNQFSTCLWMLVKSGKTEVEASESLMGTQKQEKNELLFKRFGINYKKLPEIFRQGSCVFKTEVTDIVKYNENGSPVKRLRTKSRIIHSENIYGRSFWNEYPSLVEHLGGFMEEVSKIKPDYIRSFLKAEKLMPCTWIVVRIDGCHFHRFSDAHEFEKPNDEQALSLMNSCAMAILQEFEDVIFSYGVSDEYSFVLRRDCSFYQRQASDIVSVIVSSFTSSYVMKWKEFFPGKQLKYPPAFDGRAICYPSTEILRDYLSWRQVDCHINNQYNTCFWTLVKSGKSKREAQNTLKGTQARDKNELLAQQFGIDYNTLPLIFRLGSSVFRELSKNKNEATVDNLQDNVVVAHCNIIEESFWEARPYILSLKQ